MADAVETFKKFPLSLQLILGGAALFLIGSFLDMYGDFDGNLLDLTTGVVILAAIVVGAVFAYLKKFGNLSNVLILLGAGGALALLLPSFLDDGGDLGIGGFLLLIGAIAAAWGAVASEKK